MKTFWSRALQVVGVLSTAFAGIGVDASIDNPTAGNLAQTIAAAIAALGALGGSEWLKKLKANVPDGVEDLFERVLGKQDPVLKSQAEVLDALNDLRGYFTKQADTGDAPRNEDSAAERGMRLVGDLACCMAKCEYGETSEAK